MKKYFVLLFILTTIPPVFSGDRVRLDPMISYKMSRDGGFFRWGDGHRYNGNIFEARQIWWQSLTGILVTTGGIIGLCVASYNTQFEGGKDNAAMAIVGSSVAMIGGGVYYSVIRNKDISTAAIHANIINVQFGGTKYNEELP